MSLRWHRSLFDSLCRRSSLWPASDRCCICHLFWGRGSARRSSSIEWYLGTICLLRFLFFCLGSWGRFRVRGSWKCRKYCFRNLIALRCWRSASIRNRRFCSRFLHRWRRGCFKVWDLDASSCNFIVLRRQMWFGWWRWATSPSRRRFYLPFVSSMTLCIVPSLC